jgi:MoxR-like ATPase
MRSLGGSLPAARAASRANRPLFVPTPHEVGDEVTRRRSSRLAVLRLEPEAQVRAIGQREEGSVAPPPRPGHPSSLANRGGPEPRAHDDGRAGTQPAASAWLRVHVLTVPSRRAATVASSSTSPSARHPALEDPLAQPAPARRPASAGTDVASLFDALIQSVERVIQGKREQIRLAVVCLLAEGHLLIEDVPGVGKTSLAKALARSIAATAHRIQFTPDLLPSDVLGVSVWNRASNEFEFRPGGVFAHVVLADEINRASPKTQSALLEAMEERQVTVDARTYALPRPFLVIATQNPVELEGTYPLPEAQLDRFLMRLPMGYPGRDAEVAILETQGAGHMRADALEPVATATDVAAAADAISLIHVAPALQAYIVDLAVATRRHADLALGVSPRGALALQRAARASAAGSGRDYVVPDDVKGLASAILEHRMLLAPEAELRGVTAADVVRTVLAAVPVPGTAG